MERLVDLSHRYQTLFADMQNQILKSPNFSENHSPFIRQSQYPHVFSLTIDGGRKMQSGFRKHSGDGTAVREVLLSLVTERSQFSFGNI